MKNISKILITILAVVMIISMTACADMTWSYRDSKTTAAPGVYIYYMSGAYAYAENQVATELAETTDPTDPTEATNPEDIFSKDIENIDGEKVNARDFILEESDKAVKTYLYVRSEFEEAGLELTAEQLEAASKNADDAWAYYGTAYESLGISKDSFYNAEYLFAAQYEALFKHIYQEGGSKEVSDKEIEEYYLDNYTTYSYFPVTLYTTETSEDGTTSTSTALSEDEIKEINDALETAVDDINDGKLTYEEFATQYVEDNELTSDPTVAGTEVLEDSSAPEDIIKALEDLDSKKATTITVGEDNTAVTYLIYKGDINDTLETTFATEGYDYSVLQKMKSEEYSDDVSENAQKHECEKNQAVIDKYQPEMLIPKSE